MDRISINATEKALILQEKDKIAQIFLHTIVSIVCDRPYCRIETKDRKSQLLSGSLNAFSTILPSHFRMINKSMIINLIHIAYVV